MTKKANPPYLVQRGRSSAFRIVVPADLRDVSRLSSLSSSLGRVDTRTARTIVHALAALWRGTFDEVRQLKTNPRLHPLTRLQLQFDEALRRHNQILQGHLTYLHELGVAPAVQPHQRKQVACSPAQWAATSQPAARASDAAPPSEGPANRAPEALVPLHETACTEAPSHQPAPAIPTNLQGAAPLPLDGPQEVTIQAIIDEFIARGAPQDQLPMLKKHRSCLTLLGRLHGHLPIRSFTQTHVNQFFRLVNQMPPGGGKADATTPWWEIASSNNGETIARGTFDGTHRASMGAFLAWAIGNHGDGGFPRHITIAHIKYTGTRKYGINKQRGLREDELKRLIEGPEFIGFSRDPAQVHKCWLILLALYTGARANELCQINPQTDWVQRDGVEMLYITGTALHEDESAGTIRKTVKNQSSQRHVPIHPRLIELGLLRYLSAARDAGYDRLFCQWGVKDRKSSARAEEWVRDHFEAIGLRDDTPGQRVVGLHAFRSTMLGFSVEHDLGPVGCITGHSGDMDGQKAAYIGGPDGIKPRAKLALLSKLAFPIDPPLPVAVSVSELKRNASGADRRRLARLRR